MNAHADDGANTMRMRHQDIVPQADSGKCAVHPLHVVTDQPNRHYGTILVQNSSVALMQRSLYGFHRILWVMMCYCFVKCLGAAILPDRRGRSDVHTLEKYQLMKFRNVTLAMNVLIIGCTQTS